MSYSPIKKIDGKQVGYACMCADVPVESTEAKHVSSYFLLLTGVTKDITKDIIQYFCANFARHPVQQVFFTKEEDCAVVMFSSDIGDKTPGKCAVL